MFDEDVIFCPPSFDEQIYYDETMPPIFDDYCDDTYAIKKKFAYVESSEISMLVDHEKNALGAGYIVELIHDATENYYEEHMLVGVAIISSFLSMCLNSWSYAYCAILC